MEAKGQTQVQSWRQRDEAPNMTNAANTENAVNTNKKTKIAKDNLFRLHVSGFPHHTRARELIYTFQPIGRMTVEALNLEYAVMACTNEDGQKALQSTKKFYIYGRRLYVRPCQPDEIAKIPESKPSPKKKRFIANKHFNRDGLDETVPPTSIDLDSDFDTQVQRILATIVLTREQVFGICSRLTHDLKGALDNIWPGCIPLLFGSITTGLGVKSSDADCLMMIPDLFRGPNVNYIDKAKAVLKSFPNVFDKILGIPTANTPIIKFLHLPTNTNCDLSFKTLLGVQNSKLIGFLLHLDPKLVPIAVVIKYWAKVHGLTGTGKLTNYALTMLFIFYLQQPEVAILPSVLRLQRDQTNEFIVDSWNAGFLDDRNLLEPSKNTSTMLELLGGFFKFYSEFNFEELVVCPYLGFPIKKECFKNTELLPDVFARYIHNTTNESSYPIRHSNSFCVQDPIEQCHNVASCVGSKLATEILLYIKHAAEVYEKEKRNNCTKFLPTILTEKPKIIQKKLQPQFSFNLNYRTDPTTNIEWQNLVRDAAFVVFKKILKLDLDKLEDTTKSDKLRECYLTTMKRALWRRSQFERAYSRMKMPFLEKEIKITEELLRIDKNEISLIFQIFIIFKDPPKTTIVIKLLEGNLQKFKEFGKFYANTVRPWFLEILKEHITDSNNKVTKVIVNGVKSEKQKKQKQTDSEDEDLPKILEKGLTITSSKSDETVSSENIADKKT